MKTKIAMSVATALIAAAVFSAATPAFAQAADTSEEKSFRDFSAQLEKSGNVGITPPAEPATPPASAAATADSAAVLEEALKKAAAERQTNTPVAEKATMQGNAPLSAQRLPSANDPYNPLGPAGNLPVGNLPPAFGATPQSQAEIQAQMSLDAEMQQKKLEEQTFDAALKSLLPLRPDQVRRTLDVFKDSREAAETPITVPEPKQVVETISLDPSDAPTVILMSPSMVTTVTILDSSGAPWPIQDVSWAGKFEITPPEEGGHIIRITPESAHGVGNISIRLVDLVTPITMSLKTGIDEVYYRFDARIPKAGPLAKPSLIEYGGIKAVAGKDSDMDGILDGTPPVSAEKMKVNGADGRTTAYKIADRLYLRTPLTLLSPSWDASVSSADGMNVYSLGQAPVILLSDRGRMVRAHVADDEVTP